MTQQQNILVLATRNAGKIAELADGLRAFGYTVLGMDAFAALADVEETGHTFEANALLKAKATAFATGHIAVADDSGLEVAALNNAPGVYSARYADNIPPLPNESRDARNCRKLLQALEYVPDAERTATFVCVMAACTPCGRTLTVRGTWEGRIARIADGTHGFGYDPIFFDPALGCTPARLSREQKNARSHRGAALRALAQAWQDFVL